MLPEMFKTLFPDITTSTLELALPVEDMRGEVVWFNSSLGKISVVDAFLFLLSIGPTIS